MTDKAVYGSCRYGYTKYGVVNVKFDEVISELEKRNVTRVYIDYKVIKPGLADWTPLDEVLRNLEK